MSYKALSLKWRPQKFSELEGQEVVGQILTQGLKSGSLHPAFIFSGPKGTGKTSSARILAKALRCEKGQIEPCCQCSACQEIQNGSDLNVMEIDGASNTGVDSIRELKESVQYMPSSGKYRIYIIDEAHMLSQSAFNALLKTLEEPPSHVIFIMATTELRKIPATVASRCQILHFRSLSKEMIQKRLNMICQAEKIQIDDEALGLITQQAEHSMRDAQVLLDQMASLGNKKISAESVIQVLGLTRRSFIHSVLKSLVQRDLKSVLTLIPQLEQTDPQSFLNSLLIEIRNLLIVKLAGEKTPPCVFLTPSEIEELQNLSQQASSEDIHMLFDMGLKGREDLLKSWDSLMTLEMVLLRMSEAPRVEAVFARGDEGLFQTQTPSAGPMAAAKDSSQESLTLKSSTHVSKENSSVQQTQRSNLNPFVKPKSMVASKGKKFSEVKTKSSAGEKKSHSEKTLRSSEMSVENTAPLQSSKTQSLAGPATQSSLNLKTEKNWGDFIQFVKSKDPQTAARIRSFSISHTPSEITLTYSTSNLFLERKAKDPQFKKTVENYLREFFKKSINCIFVSNNQDSVYTQKSKEQQKQMRDQAQKLQQHPTAQKITELFQAQVVLEPPPRS